jgi:hypothetical protein
LSPGWAAIEGEGYPGCCGRLSEKYSKNKQTKTAKNNQQNTQIEPTIRNGARLTIRFTSIDCKPNSRWLSGEQSRGWVLERGENHRVYFRRFETMRTRSDGIAHPKALR